MSQNSTSRPPGSARFSGRDFTGEELAAIRSWLAPEKLCREQLARRVCEEFRWLNAQGKLKTMSCKVALLRMERARLIVLPLPRKRCHNRQRKPGAEWLLPLPESPLALSAQQLREVRLEVVQTKAERALYHRHLQQHHYLGAGSMAGAQLRYLARSGGTVVGALGFGASAWLVAGRDRFLGWSDTSRRRRLHLVVTNHRLLILPWARTPNLGSRPLA